MFMWAEFMPSAANISLKISKRRGVSLRNSCPFPKTYICGILLGNLGELFLQSLNDVDILSIKLGSELNAFVLAAFAREKLLMKI
jgi:hypothetical protein